MILNPVNQFIKVKQVLLDASDYHIHLNSISGVDIYYNLIRLEDMQIYLESENTTLIDSDNTHVLEKPTLIIYQTFKASSGPTRGTLLSEFQLLVNVEPNGRIFLDFYTLLIRGLLINPLEVSRWSQVNLRPDIDSYVEFPVFGGEIIHADLTNKLFVRSVKINFDVLGEYYAGF